MHQAKMRVCSAAGTKDGRENHEIRGNSRLMHRKEMPRSDDNIRHERCRLVIKQTSGQKAKRQQGKSPITTTLMKEKRAPPSASCCEIGYRKKRMHTLPCRASIRQRDYQVVC